MSTSNQGQVRIIAGQWRSRKLKVINKEGLRPTTDRIRETLFNWIQERLPGSRCLDLFAGSGALGFEAASRGAAYVHMLEHDVAIVATLKDNSDQLSAQQVAIEQTDSIKYISNSCLAVADKPYDIIFVDPPYHSGLVEKCCNLLEHGQWLSDNACIYVECDIDEKLNNMPASWDCSKSKKAGRVGYYLYHKSR